MRVVFFGTPAFAVPSLAALIVAGFEVPLVVTQPDRPVGRSGRPRRSPVGEVALERGIPTEKPERLRSNDPFFARLAAVRPDAIAVVAYGKLLPSQVLDLPRLGCVNVHASLLPKYRGASPISAAILAGDRETGVVTMRVVPELDAGPIYLERRVEIGVRDDTAFLSERLAREGADLLVETLRRLESGSIALRAQVGQPTFTRPLEREEGRVDWSERASEIERRLRAFSPWPGLHSVLNGERVKLLELEVADTVGPPLEPGTLREQGGQVTVAAGDGTALVLKRVQRAGRKPTTGSEFLRGLPPSRPPRFERGT
jgi:methionyl-tRNA formyltransferase